MIGRVFQKLKRLIRNNERSALEKLLKKYYGNRSYDISILVGPEDEGFCDRCKKSFSKTEFNIYNDLMEADYCLNCSFPKSLITKEEYSFIQSITPLNSETQFMFDFWFNVLEQLKEIHPIEGIKYKIPVLYQNYIWIPLHEIFSVRIQYHLENNILEFRLMDDLVTHLKSLYEDELQKKLNVELDWSPDGKSVFYERSFDLYKTNEWHIVYALIEKVVNDFLQLSSYLKKILLLWRQGKI